MDVVETRGRPVARFFYQALSKIQYGIVGRYNIFDV